MLFTNALVNKTIYPFVIRCPFPHFFFNIKFPIHMPYYALGLDYEISHKVNIRNYGLVCLASFTDNQK